MPNRPCAADGCDLPYYCRGFCKKHYDKDLKQRNPGYAERQRENVRQWVAANPDRKRRSDQGWARRQSPETRARRAERSRQSALRCKYNMTVEEYDQLLASQDGRCAICREVPQKWHVDHDHRTGAVRGALCNRCNNGLGLLGDDAESLRRALTYLDRVHDEGFRHT